MYVKVMRVARRRDMYESATCRVESDVLIQQCLPATKEEFLAAIYVGSDLL
jgi:hypothetical protein